MARLLQHARKALLSSPSLHAPPPLQTLTRPLSPLPLPPPLSPSPARSYIADMRRSAFQENLLRILRTEIDYEVDVRPPEKPVQKFSSFVVEDRPGVQWIRLRREFGRQYGWDEEVKVDATMFDYAVSDDAKAEESGGEEKMKLHISLIVDVGKNWREFRTEETTLQFICSAWPDALEIKHLRLVENKNLILCPYMGPRFKDLDEELQDALQEFLGERGVDDKLAAFLHEYMMNKDRREYVRWMENVKAYVEK